MTAPNSTEPAVDTDEAQAAEPAQAPPVEAPKAETDWQAEARKWESRAKENKDAAARLAEYEDAAKTEQQKLADRAEAAEKRAAALEAEALRSRVAAAKGLTPGQAKRLTGDDEESLLADADELLAEFKPSPAVDIDQGARGGNKSEPTVEDFVAQFNKPRS